MRATCTWSQAGGVSAQNRAKEPQAYVRSRKQDETQQIQGKCSRQEAKCRPPGRPPAGAPYIYVRSPPTQPHRPQGSSSASQSTHISATKLEQETKRQNTLPSGNCPPPENGQRRRGRLRRSRCCMHTQTIATNKDTKRRRLCMRPHVGWRMCLLQ
ncbi:hypothetical protein GQ54DRAFT_42242 [Martensiomyces pterosporus]|nr:hypothetical protein GQ54DRAFT_42242 [Martensiomyces pterosporus]